MDKLIRLGIKGISYSQTQSGAYALILEELPQGRKLPIIIGSFEAQAIAIALDKDMKPVRPLTHDLFYSLSSSFGIKIGEVIINKLKDGVFYSNLICSDEQGKTLEIDSRTSDAIALAVRFSAPIFVLNDIMEQAGVYLDVTTATVEEDEGSPDEEPKQAQVKPGGLASKSAEELKTMLQEAVQQEDYEKAAQVRDELNKRQ